MSTLIPLSEIVKYYTPELRNFLISLGNIAQTMNIVEMVTPVNASQEKEKWLEAAERGEWKNPHFQYNKDLLATVANSKQQLEDLFEIMGPALSTVSNEAPGKVLCELTKSRYKEIESTILLAQHILSGQDSHAGEDAKAIYGYPTAQTVSVALTYADCLGQGGGKLQQDDANLRTIRNRLKELEFDANRIRENFILAAEQCGFSETRPVEISEYTTAIDVRDKSSRGPIVTIPASRKVNGLKLVELIGHEILCHWRDSERAALALPLLGSGALKPADEVLYEGHATLTDYNTKFNLGDEAPLRQSPFYILAMAEANNRATFAETAASLYKLIRPTRSDKSAMALTWTTCLRVFRGSSGNEKGYVFTKDRAYFEGRVIAERLHEEKLDSILEISTLSEKDIQVLRTVVAFEQKENNQIKTVLSMWNLIYQLLDGKL